MFPDDATPSDAPQRILRREWTRYKPYLPKSISLPQLQLRPSHRPLFTCCRCGFSNTYIPMCLWCMWTSDDAKHAFEDSMPRGRRMSAPCNVASRITMRRTQTPPLHSEVKHSIISNHNAINAAPCTAMQPPGVPRTKRRMPIVFAGSDSYNIDHPSSPVIIDLPTLGHTPPRTLRRKKHMTVLRQKSSSSLRRRATASTRQRDALQPKPFVFPDPQVRLGTPGRPYYTAIRANMSRPTSPQPPPPPTTPNRHSSPAPSRPPELGHGHRVGDANMRHSFATAPRARPAPSHVHGFSLSGETELHMALARWRSQEAVEGESEYRFLDTRKGVKQKVKRLSRGLKDLLMGRA
ncbi:hypothetical protein PLICRDRAFT_52842 [Plicaturopsis crispa FD-325 SS-3]|nr:hypothetical protein PLICRDRAFT_52842 [Plicaturopsis crispa FD-325 SS-3]